MDTCVISIALVAQNQNTVERLAYRRLIRNWLDSRARDAFVSLLDLVIFFALAEKDLVIFVHCQRRTLLSLCTAREGPCYLCAVPEKDLIIFVHCQRRTLLSLCTASEGPYYLCALPKKDLVIFVHCQRRTILSLCTAREGPCYLCALPENDLVIFVHCQKRTLLSLCTAREGPSYLCAPAENLATVHPRLWHQFFFFSHSIARLEFIMRVRLDRFLFNSFFFSFFSQNFPNFPNCKDAVIVLMKLRSFIKCEMKTCT